MKSFTDVSHSKCAESLQTHDAAAAQEAKRQQGNFIDVTSHELRNPLGAVMQCDEEIAHSMQDTEDQETLPMLQNNVDTAEIILA